MKVLLAIDSSAASQNVINAVLSRPWRAGTAFCVMSVVDMRHWEGLPALVEDAKREAQILVTAATGKLTQAGYEVFSETLAGVPKKVIPEYAEQWRADLVMIGSHGLGAVTGFLLGSVALAVLRTSPCSIEIVRHSLPGSQTASHGMKLLLGTDGSELATKAAYSVANRPWPEGSEIKVISVRDLPVLESQATISSLSPVYPESLLQNVLENARKRTEAAVTEATTILTSAGLKVCDTPQEMPVGDPRSILLGEANTWPADLIVVGSHGRHGFERILLGSVSESIALHAHCSVEVIHA